MKRLLTLPFPIGGGEQHTKATKATLAQYQVSIITSDLGQTLQDGIEVAQSLGLRFLWVDSLCIIQDDPQDGESFREPEISPSLPCPSMRSHP
jgi:hypothetical protein